jgi:sugar phosphate permease
LKQIFSSPFVRVALPFISGYFVSYVYRMVNAVLAPTLVAEFGLTAGGLGLLSSMYFLSFALCQLPVGLAMDRFGPRRVNAALLLVAAAGGAWFAHAESAAAAMAARALIGVGFSVALMSWLRAFVIWYPPERLSTMNAVAFSVSAGVNGRSRTTRNSMWSSVVCTYCACRIGGIWRIPVMLEG